MRLILQNSSSANKDAEVIFGVLLIPIVITVIVAAAFFLPQSIIPKCNLYQNFGIACPACGSTRALQLIFHGDFLQAFRLQPFMITGALCLMVYSVYSYLVVFRIIPALRVVEISRTDRRILMAAGLLLLTADWLYVLSHY